MRRLTLVRHAKSDWSLPGQQDWDRALNRRGQRDAPEMARRLRGRRLKPDLVLTSPAVRAVTTANDPRARTQGRSQPHRTGRTAVSRLGPLDA
jgi:phosphohistidine phosphatase